ncbi:vegetative cell wall protein gp1-like [Hypomesus transpacificus]|uniref:vegetative cell wall protein gp1-like n=1 Tax=Hypomesus transpacificus TaxID=137520 RepID=UPI001F07E8AB|nr:vegetative cell wall protein gp1-like [Hypomesus transpacificus]
MTPHGTHGRVGCGQGKDPEEKQGYMERETELDRARAVSTIPEMSNTALLPRGPLPVLPRGPLPVLPRGVVPVLPRGLVPVLPSTEPSAPPEPPAESWSTLAPPEHPAPPLHIQTASRSASRAAPAFHPASWPASRTALAFVPAPRSSS